MTLEEHTAAATGRILAVADDRRRSTADDLFDPLTVVAARLRAAVRRMPASRTADHFAATALWFDAAAELHRTKGACMGCEAGGCSTLEIAEALLGVQAGRRPA